MLTQRSVVMNRRRFLEVAIGSAGLLLLGSLPGGCGLVTARGSRKPGVVTSELLEPDANGIRLPPGFRSREIARSGGFVPNTGYTWHPFPDGAATFAADDGGWILVSNSEIPGNGGVSAMRFDSEGEVVDAYPILTGTSRNCSGGGTPWGTWISCEEHSAGLSWECDPFGKERAVQCPALGRFTHEAVAVDGARGHVYLTEDETDGRFYRFTPERIGGGGRFDLTSGALEVLRVVDGGRAEWLAVPKPNPGQVDTPTRRQVSESTPFDGGEGVWVLNDAVYFTTKGDDRLWMLDLSADTLSVLYDRAKMKGPLSGGDQIIASPTGDLLVAEDGGHMQLVAIAQGDHTVVPFLQIVGQDGSEITGPAFDPSGSRLYVGSQRGPEPNGLGIIYEISGPFIEK